MVRFWLIFDQFSLFPAIFGIFPAFSGTNVPLFSQCRPYYFRWQKFLPIEPIKDPRNAKITDFI